MILTVTANAALDITYGIPELRVHASHRVRQVWQRAGGKGINLASAAAAMGCEVVVAGCAGGQTGTQIEHDLDRRGLPRHLSPLRGESRRTVTIVDESGDATVFNEPGALQDTGVVDALVTDVTHLLDSRPPRVLALCGSLPTGMDGHCYRRIVEIAESRGIPVVLDATGAPLTDALPARPDVVKPNRSELATTTGQQTMSDGVASLRDAGARTVVVSDGAAGIHLFPEDGGHLHAFLDHTLSGNPTGAGDAAAAAVCAGIDGGWSSADLLRAAIAWSAAAVLQPTAGEVDPADVERLLASVHLKEFS
ncbi:1-phosphofructokinase family hexose kinase [Rudaeicoccus suwonensis]|uniref:Tagatose 6-phosphate kinase n=1 Tax=Rudaeicoccus suwonensis TaxID=657409 RepID=A0A561E9F9_9MICO|nr:hexose kinase [Rudaeicoccus suwonensis]TWE12210.1 tagatose 6-phosphate kinase [Rudaeicoccus suwonensis]